MGEERTTRTLLLAILPLTHILEIGIIIYILSLTVAEVQILQFALVHVSNVFVYPYPQFDANSTVKTADDILMVCFFVPCR